MQNSTTGAFMKNFSMKSSTLAVRGLMIAALAATPLVITGCHSGEAGGSNTTQANDITKVKTVVVIYLENRSFDHLFGHFPGANGLNSYNASLNQQVDFDGKTILPHLNPVWGSLSDPSLSQVSSLPNAPFQLDAAPVNLDPKNAGPDLVHRFYQNQMQINGGANNMFAAYSNRGGMSMGYYDGASDVPNLWKMAQQYTLADNFFMGAFGGSFLNHQYLVCACSPNLSQTTAPAGTTPAQASRAITADGSLTGTALKIDPTSPSSALNGKVKFVQDGEFTPDGYAINTILPPYQPSGAPTAAGADPMLANLAGDTTPTGNGPVMPPIDSSKVTTIGDLLTNANVNWKWYAGAWNDALKEGTSANIGTTTNPYKIIWTENPGSEDFEPHHQPFNYYTRFDPTTASGKAERAAHLKDATDMLADAAAGTLPPVVFYKPAGNVNAHPNYSDVKSADADLANVMAALQASPQYKNMAIVITTDENGGFFDHATPPKGDRFGPGTRVPAVIVSPYAKKGFIDHTYYDTASILKFITKRFNLPSLPGLRAATGDLTNAFDFTQN